MLQTNLHFKDDLFFRANVIVYNYTCLYHFVVYFIILLILNEFTCIYTDFVKIADVLKWTINIAFI